MTFEDRVEAHLDYWGTVFALHRNHATVGNMPSAWEAAMNHKGRSIGNKPLSVDPVALQIEMLVSKVGRESPTVAAVLRGYYCGRGTRGDERYRTAMELAGHKFSRRSYYAYLRLGVTLVQTMLWAVAQSRPSMVRFG